MDWIAGICELAGLWVVGNRNRIGFCLNIAGAWAWITYVLTSQSTYGLLLVVIPALLINLRNFKSWAPDG